MTWLECPIEHMVKPEEGYQKGDECPTYHSCGGTLKKVEKSEKRLESAKKLNQVIGIEGDIIAPEDVDARLSPYEVSYKFEHHLRHRAVSEFVKQYGREYLIELLEAHEEIYGGFPGSWSKFKEDPYSFCLVCGKVCKSSRGRKIHKSKKHRRSIL